MAQEGQRRLPWTLISTYQSAFLQFMCMIKYGVHSTLQHGWVSNVPWSNYVRLLSTVINTLTSNLLLKTLNLYYLTRMHHIADSYWIYLWRLSYILNSILVKFDPPWIKSTVKMLHQCLRRVSAPVSSLLCSFLIVLNVDAKSEFPPRPL